MRKRVVVLGIVLGILVPHIGVFVGLQVSTMLGNILAFPLITISFITDTPFGMWSPALWILAVVVSIVVWTVIIAVIDNLIRRK